MSTSISLTVDTGGPHHAVVWDEFRCPAKLARLSRDAGLALDSLNLCRAEACRPVVEDAVKTMELMASGRAATTGSWGGFERLVPKLRDLVEAMRLHPWATVRVEL